MRIPIPLHIDTNLIIMEGFHEHQLTLIENDGVLLADSREVSRLVDKPHNDLMKSIRTYKGYLTKGDFSLSEFFVESTYLDPTGRTLPCYLLTRKGCDLIAHKMTGERGVLFTATYVTKFEEMERRLTAPKVPSTYKEALVALVSQIEETERLQIETARQTALLSEQAPKVDYYEQILSSEGTLLVSQIANDYGISAADLNLILKSEGVQYRRGKQWVLASRYARQGLADSCTTLDVTAAPI